MHDGEYTCVHMNSCVVLCFTRKKIILWPTLLQESNINNAAHNMGHHLQPLALSLSCVLPILDLGLDVGLGFL